MTVRLSPIAPRARARLPPLHRHTLHGCLTREVPGLRAVRGAHCRELPALYLLIVKSVRHSGHKRKKRREIWSRARGRVSGSRSALDEDVLPRFPLLLQRQTQQPNCTSDARVGSSVSPACTTLTFPPPPSLSFCLPSVFCLLFCLSKFQI